MGHAGEAVIQCSGFEPQDMDFQDICGKQENTAIYNRQQASLCFMRVCFSSRICSGVCQQNVLKNIKREVSLHIYTCLIHVYVCMCTVFVFFSRSHTPAFSILSVPSLTTYQCRCSYIGFVDFSPFLVHQAAFPAFCLCDYEGKERWKGLFCTPAEIGGHFSIFKFTFSTTTSALTDW